MSKTLVEKIQEALPETTVQFQQIWKTNDICKDALVITPNGSSIGATIYLEPDITVTDILNLYATADFDELDESYIFSLVDSKEVLLSRSRLMVIRKDWNKNILQMYPYYDALDLAFIPYLLFPGDGSGFTKTIKISHNLLEHVGITDTNELFFTAKENTASDVRIDSMADVLQKLCKEREEVYEAVESDFDINVVTNESRLYGAGILACQKPFEQLCKFYNCNELIVLPSSIHEVLVVPTSSCGFTYEFNDMVKTVNAQFVMGTEVLSDHAYIYEKGVGIKC